jgi:TonB family protein
MLRRSVKLGALFVAVPVLALLVLVAGCEGPDPFLGNMCGHNILSLVPTWEQRSSPPLAAAAVARSAGKPCAPRVYPAESFRAGEQGITWVGYTTGDDGSVLTVEVARSSGYPRLDAAALEHVRTCKFRPNVSHGMLLEKWVIYWSAR